MTDMHNSLDIIGIKYSIKVIVKYLTNKILNVEDSSLNEDLMCLRKEHDRENLEHEEFLASMRRGD